MVLLSQLEGISYSPMTREEQIAVELNANMACWIGLLWVKSTIRGSNPIANSCDEQ